MVHKLFQLLKSTAVGIHPISGIKKAIALDSTLKNSYEIDGFTGPFTIHRMKAASVEISSTIPMILIKPSRILNLPIMRRLPQTPKQGCLQPCY